MSTKIFITAGTGYVGGSVLDALAKRNPEYMVTALLRNVPEGFAARYPNVRVVLGTFDDTKLIEDTAAQNDIVIHGGKPKHLSSLQAHIAGILRRSQPGPGFLIRLAGTGIIADWQDGPYAVLNPKVWSDIDDIDTITDFEDTYLHRPADKILQDAATQHGDRLKTAIITPSGIYGRGKGLGNVRSLLIPEMCENIIEMGYSFYALEGANRRSWIHVDDVVNVYLKLVEAAAAGGGNAVWGKEGYYFATSQELSQLDLAKAAGEVLYKHGLIPIREPKSLTVKDVREMRGGSSWEPMGVYTWACNTRVRPDRATSLLGFAPSAPTVLETLEQDLLDAVEHVKRNGPTYCPSLKL